MLNLYISKADQPGNEQDVVVQLKELWLLDHKWYFKSMSKAFLLPMLKKWKKEQAESKTNKTINAAINKLEKYNKIVGDF